jgi:hypothetical protein
MSLAREVKNVTEPLDEFIELTAFFLMKRSGKRIPNMITVF